MVVANQSFDCESPSLLWHFGCVPRHFWQPQKTERNVLSSIPLSPFLKDGETFYLLMKQTLESEIFDNVVKSEAFLRNYI